MTQTHEADIWRAAGQSRAVLYRWFAEVFAKEIPGNKLMEWIEDCRRLDSAFQQFDLGGQSARLQTALSSLSTLPPADRALELAADFAQIFLLGERDSAPPYASYYLHEEKLLQQHTAKRMREYLRERGLSRHPDFRETDDHLSVYLHLMSLLCQTNAAQSIATTAHEQYTLLTEALLPWLPQLLEKAQKINLLTDIYPALLALLLAFVRADQAMLQDYATALNTASQN